MISDKLLHLFVSISAPKTLLIRPHQTSLAIVSYFFEYSLQSTSTPQGGARLQGTALSAQILLLSGWGDGARLGFPGLAGRALTASPPVRFPPPHRPPALAAPVRLPPAVENLSTAAPRQGQRLDQPQ